MQNGNRCQICDMLLSSTNAKISQSSLLVITYTFLLNDAWRKEEIILSLWKNVFFLCTYKDSFAVCSKKWPDKNGCSGVFMFP